MLLVVLLLCYMCHSKVLPSPIALNKWWSSSTIENKEKKGEYFQKIYIFNFYIIYIISHYFQEGLIFGYLILKLQIFFQEFSKKSNINKNIFIFYLHIFTK
jgi:hypothetical protein